MKSITLMKSIILMKCILMIKKSIIMILFLFQEINACDSKHYLILFRNAQLQFRAIYSYDPDREDVNKLHGTGPKTVTNEMIDKFYK